MKKGTMTGKELTKLLKGLPKVKTSSGFMKRLMDRINKWKLTSS